MSELASHHERILSRYPDDRLLIVFNVDGTIIDKRYSVLRALKSYDLHHRTGFFKKLQVADVKLHENQVEALVRSLAIPANRQKEILAWCEKRRAASACLPESVQPHAGVLEVIRWFQLRPNTFVGLNSHQPEALRPETLRSLDALGREYRVHFSDELLYMNPDGRAQQVQLARVDDIKHFRDAGYRILALVDHEPDRLHAAAALDPQAEILLLHANPVFDARQTDLPSNSVRGNGYDLTELIPEKALPPEIDFIWHGINDEANLRQFLASDVTWGEVDVRLDPLGFDVILRHDCFKQRPGNGDESWLSFEDVLRRFQEQQKSIKIDLKAGGALINKVLAILAERKIDDSRLWFNGNVEHLQEAGFRQIAKAHPRSTLQCPIDFLAPLVTTMPEKAREILELYRSWGLNLFSLSWLTPDFRLLLEQICRWGYEVNIYKVPDLESFLQAALLLPRSITADFNFPKWRYFGRGSGEDGKYHEYA